MAVKKFTPIKGLLLEPDTSPYTGTTLTEDANVIDGNRFISVSGFWWVHYSYGVELDAAEASLNVTRIECYGYVNVTPTDWYDASHDSFKVYKSDDNSTWTHVEDFDGPSLHDLGLNEWGTTLELTTPTAAKYWKVVYVDATTVAFLPGGSSGNIGEVEIYGVEYSGYFSGYVYEQGGPIARTLYLHNRSDGSLVGTTTSSGNGYYYLETTHPGSHYIVCLDDPAGEDYNDLIIGDIYPTTISG